MRPRTQIGHGVYAWARKEKCQCTVCKAAVARYSKGLRYDKARGYDRRALAAPVRDHVFALMQAGATPTQIANAAGVARTGVRNLMGGMAGNPPPERIGRATAAKLMALTEDQVLGEFRLLPAIGVKRRIQALERMGHSKLMISKALGVTESAVHDYMHRAKVTSATVAEVHKVYVALRNIDGGNTKSKWKSYRENYAPPMSWDDDTIDDPMARPEGACCVVTDCTRLGTNHSLCQNHAHYVRNRGGWDDTRKYYDAVRALNKRRRQDGAKVLVQITELIDLGYRTPEAVAEHLGMSKSYIDNMWKKVA